MHPIPLPFAAGCLLATASAQTVFGTDFETALPAAVAPGTATLTGVQGYAGYGPAGNQFGGTFLRSATGNVVTLPFALIGTTGAGSLAIPNDPGFVGLQLFGQGWAIAPGVNPTGIVFSNGLRILIYP